MPLNKLWNFCLSRLKYYADKDLNVTVELKQQFIHDKKDKEEFLLKWLGYDKEQSTWEPAENLNEDVPVLVAKYMETATSKRKSLLSYYWNLGSIYN
jgi:hypothetical protein